MRRREGCATRLGHKTTYSPTINGGQWSLTNAQGSGRFPRYTRIFDILVDIGVPAEKEVIQ
jgi:hypothetical protein